MLVRFAESSCLAGSSLRRRPSVPSTRSRRSAVASRGNDLARSSRCRLAGAAGRSRAGARFDSHTSRARTTTQAGAASAKGTSITCLLPAAVDPLHDAPADRAGAERQGAGRGLDDAGASQAFLRDGQAAGLRVPAPMGARIAALLRAVDKPDPDARLVYFRVADRRRVPRPADRRTRAARASTCARCASSTRRSSSRSARRSRHRRSPSSTGRAVSAPTPPSKPATSSTSGSAC